MKNARSSLFGVLALAASLSIPTVVLAAGEHAGGHHAFAAGAPGTAAEVDRTIEVKASDIKFDLELIDVAAGETVRFVITNVGKIDHDFTLGAPAEHQAHQQEMMKMMQHPGMEHSDGNAVMLKPGETKELIWTVAAAENLEFACNVPGHYQAGMKGDIKVSGQAAEYGHSRH